MSAGPRNAANRPGDGSRRERAEPGETAGERVGFLGDLDALRHRLDPVPQVAELVGQKVEGRPGGFGRLRRRLEQPVVRRENDPPDRFLTLLTVDALRRRAGGTPAA